MRSRRNGFLNPSRSTRSTLRPSREPSSSCMVVSSQRLQKASSSKETSTSTSLDGPKSSRSTEPNRANSRTFQRRQKDANSRWGNRFASLSAILTMSHKPEVFGFPSAAIQYGTQINCLSTYHAPERFSIPGPGKARAEKGVRNQ